jgi:6-pyruvoyl-tetrahydropterin synthase
MTTFKPKTPKRSTFQIQRDKVIITQLYLKGYSQVEVAAKLQEETKEKYLLTQSQISQEIKKILEEWQETYLSEIDAWKWKELSKLDNLERVCWEAYEESKQPRTIKQTNFSGALGTPLEGMPTPKGKNPLAFSGETSITNHGGDVRFLAEIRFICKQRIELLGLNSPIKVDATVSTFSKMTDEELKAFIDANKEVLEK